MVVLLDGGSGHSNWQTTGQTEDTDLSLDSDGMHIDAQGDYNSGGGYATTQTYDFSQWDTLYFKFEMQSANTSCFTEIGSAFDSSGEPGGFNQFYTLEQSYPWQSAILDFSPVETTEFFQIHQAQQTIDPALSEIHLSYIELRSGEPNLNTFEPETVNGTATTPSVSVGKTYRPSFTADGSADASMQFPPSISYSFDTINGEATVDWGPKFFPEFETITGTGTASPLSVDHIRQSGFNANGTAVGSMETKTPVYTYGFETVQAGAETVFDVPLSHLYWTINGESYSGFLDESREWDTLELKFRASETEVENGLRPLDDATGKFEVVERSDGTYQAVSRSTGGNLTTIESPVGRNDLRSQTEYFVEKYDETLIDDSGSSFEVELTLTANEPKTGGNSHDAPTHDTETEWLMEFADGSVATGRVRSDVKRSGKMSVDGTRTLSTTLDRGEARIVEESLNRQSAVRLRQVPDDRDVIEDVSETGRNTVSVTAPTGMDGSDTFISTGDYIVHGWSTSYISDDFYKVDLTLTPKMN